MSSFLDRSADAETQNEEARIDGEENGERKDQEHEREEHQDLLASGLFDEDTLGILARVAGLRVQDGRERGTVLESGDHLVDGA